MRFVRSLPLVVGTALAFGASRPTAAAPAETPPNFIFILADDWGWGDLGCYGNTRIQTPNLDRLASQGTRFTQYYVNAPVCSPTRAAILTGRFPSRDAIHGHFDTPARNRARGMPDELDPAVPTLARDLKKAGYATGHFGKWHLSDPAGPMPDRYGFDEWNIDRQPGQNLWDHTVRAQSSQKIVDDTIAFIKKHKGQRFFVDTWLLDVHATLYPTDEQLAPYRSMVEPHVRFNSPEQVYYAAATDSDKHIGRLLQALDELGLAENTIVVFSSDNGPEDGTIKGAAHSAGGSAGPFRGRKRSLYEGGVRLPFIVRWPKRTPAGRVDNTSIVAGIDFLPTFEKAAGIRLVAGRDIDGEDMLSAFRGGAFVRTKPLVWEWRFRVLGPIVNRSPMLGIRRGNWKLLLNPDRSRVELYDIPKDPTEVDNLADTHPDVVKSLSAEVLSWQAKLPKGPIEDGAGANQYPWPK